MRFAVDRWEYSRSRRPEGTFMHSDTQPSSMSNRRLRAGRIIPTLGALFLLFDSIIKLIQNDSVRQPFATFKYAESLAVPIGILVLACTVLYVMPCSSVAGAILLTAYLGRATTAQVRAGERFYFPVFFGRAGLGEARPARRPPTRASSSAPLSPCLGPSCGFA